MSDLSTYYGSTKIKNPIVLSAAGTTGTVELIKRAEENGVAAVVMKTLFEEEYSRQNPSPCYKIIRRKAGPMKSTTFYSFEQASPYGLERYAEEIHQVRKQTNIPVIASINCINESTWAKFAKVMEEAGASAIEVNRSCPYSKVTLSSQDSWTTLAADTLKAIKRVAAIPVSIKLTPQLADPSISAKHLEREGADGLVMFNRFIGLEIDIETEKPIMHGGFAGHGGIWALHYVLRWIVATSSQLNIPICASGGVAGGDDLIKLILAGAGSVQICTTTYMEGFGVISRYLERLQDYMQEKKYGAIKEFRGKVCKEIVPTDKVDRSQKFVAMIDIEVCRKCGNCSKICLHNAVDWKNGAYLINDRCTGCGLCEQLCPQTAIELVSLQKMTKFTI